MILYFLQDFIFVQYQVLCGIFHLERDFWVYFGACKWTKHVVSYNNMFYFCIRDKKQFINKL